MKKVIFLAIAAAAALTACSKSEVVDSSVMNKAISFENYIGKDAQTKALVVEKDDIPFVYVNAYLHKKESVDGAGFEATFMHKQEVTTDGDYSPMRYWPAEDQAIDFVAWVPETTTTGDAVTAVDKNIKVQHATLTFTVPEDVTEQTDLIVSGSQLDKNGGNVSLVFKHLLSRIGFQINAAGLPNDAVTKVKLESIVLNGAFASEGTVNMLAKSPVITAVAEKVTPAYTLLGEHFSYTDNIIANGETRNNDNAYIMLIPNTNTPENITVTYKIETYNEDGEPAGTITNVKTFEIEEPYEAGYAYKYIFNVSLNAITFSVDVTSWDETTPDVEINPEDKPATGDESEDPAQGEQGA